MSELKIRRGQMGDLWRLQHMLYMAEEESNGIMPPTDMLHAAHAALNMLAAGFVFVVEEGETVVGAIMLDVMSWAWNPQVKYLETQHFYVMPDHRAKKVGDVLAAQALLDAAKAMADAAGIPLIATRFFSDERNASKDAFFERSGMINLGGRHIYQPAVDAAKQAAE